MLEFWCLSPVRVAYHGSFRKNLESAFWGFGVSYLSLVRQMRAFKRAPLKCCSFDASPQSEWLITAYLERIWSQHFGVSYRSLIRQMQVFKKSTSGVLQFWCLFDASPQSEWFITAHLERIWNHHFGALDCHMSYHNLMKHMQVFKTEHLKCCSFDASPQSEWLITAHLERIWGQHFGALDCHITTWLGRCKSSKRAPLKCCSFDASPLSEWLITAHLERIWSQHFGALGCHIAAWLGRCKSSKKAPLEYCSFDAFLMPLPSQSGLSRLI